jgi:hypothetical protein
VKFTEAATKTSTIQKSRFVRPNKKRMKQPFREQIRAAIKAENEEFSGLVRSEEAKWALRALLEKRKLDFASISQTPAARR